MSLHILSQGLADHDIVTTRHMLITHVYHCGLVIIQMVKGFTSQNVRANLVILWTVCSVE